MNCQTPSLANATRFTCDASTCRATIVVRSADLNSAQHVAADRGWSFYWAGREHGWMNRCPRHHAFDAMLVAQSSAPAQLRAGKSIALGLAWVADQMAQRGHLLDRGLRITTFGALALLVTINLVRVFGGHWGIA